MGGMKKKSSSGTSVAAAEVVTPAVAHDSESEAAAMTSKEQAKRAKMRGIASTYNRTSSDSTSTKNKLGQ